MKADVYTKVVLTVIAVCLFYLYVHRTNVVSVVKAESTRGEPANSTGLIFNGSDEPMPVTDFQLLWNVNSGSGAIRLFRASGDPREVIVGSMHDLSAWKTFLNFKPINIDSNGWVYTPKTPIGGQ